MSALFTSPAGIAVTRRSEPLPYDDGIGFLVERLDAARGVYLSSGVEDPDRYSQFDFGFIDPPLQFIGHGRRLDIEALSPRGEALLRLFAPILAGGEETAVVSSDPRRLALQVAPATRAFAEEERSLQPSIFSPIRRLIAAFAGIDDAVLGLYGAFGYDLIFQFDPMNLRMPRGAGAKDLHLYFPDRVYVMDRRIERARLHSFEFSGAIDGETVATQGIASQPFDSLSPRIRGDLRTGEAGSDHAPEDYMANVETARNRMRIGDIFEVVLSRKFSAPYGGPPSRLYHLIREINPSPYEFFIQLGSEQLIGASPEMFVRVEGERVESCPISGTARRGANAMEDAERILALYNSKKDETELTMCTDVDRNDKSRICRPGTVKLLARRFIERYAGLFHTVDHVEGRLRAGLNGIDAFLSHMWAVTLTGAPKRMAVRIVEDMEASPRRWYGGAVGALGLNGNVNTGITIRTVHLENGIADYRAGSTLVYDSVPAEEETETRIKATSFFRALERLSRPPAVAAAPTPAPFRGRQVVMIDNEDSFVHTLADYIRQTGAEVLTFRASVPLADIVARRPDLVVHSPGPGRPADFDVPAKVRALAEAGLPQFGICLGLQGIVEAFGGKLALLAEPRHGKIWQIAHDGSGLFAGIESPCEFGAYHSLIAVREAMPEVLAVTARNQDGHIMALQHRDLPIAAVQFHPESILSMRHDAGHRLIENALALLLDERRQAAE